MTFAMSRPAEVAAPGWLLGVAGWCTAVTTTRSSGRRRSGPRTWRSCVRPGSTRRRRARHAGTRGRLWREVTGLGAGGSEFSTRRTHAHSLETPCRRAHARGGPRRACTRGETRTGRGVGRQRRFRVWPFRLDQHRLCVVHRGGRPLRRDPARALVVVGLPGRDRQTLTGLSGGWFTARAWVRSSGGQNAACLTLRDCGGAEKRVALPVSADGLWLRVAVSTQVTSGRCTLAVVSDANAGNWLNVDDVEFTLGRVAVPYPRRVTCRPDQERGLRRGLPRPRRPAPDPLQILAVNGVNYARLKVWVDPADGYNDKANVLRMARRVKARGMRLLIDFHYSDAWADPGKQNKPAAWAACLRRTRAGPLRPHLRRAGALRRAGHPGRHGPDRQRDQRRHALAGRPLGQLGQPRRAAQAGRSAVQAARRRPRSCCTWPRAATTAVTAGGSTTRSPLRRPVRRDRRCRYYLYWHGTAGRAAGQPVRPAGPLRQDVMVAETAYGVHHGRAGPRAPTSSPSRWPTLPGYPATPAGPGPALATVHHGRPRSPARWASSTGSPPGRRSPAPAGTRPTRPPATAGTTRRCSTSRAAPCLRSRSSTADLPAGWVSYQCWNWFAVVELFAGTPCP